MKKEGFRKYFATIIVLILILFLLFGAYKFANGFFGGILLYVVLLPVYNFLIRKKINKKVSATLTVFIALFVIIIPILLLFGIIGNEIFVLFQDSEQIENMSETISIFISKISPSISKEFINNQFINLGNKASSAFLNTITNIGSFFINLFIAFFLLYYLLIEDDLFGKIKKIIPFNEKNSSKLVDKLKDVSYSTVFVGGIIALIQGALLTISFMVFGIQGAFVWGFVTAIISFLPIIGPPLIWIPAVIIQIFQEDYFVAGGLLVFGIILSNIDNLIRPYLGQKISRIHPLITIFGVFVGISFFGIIGVFAGPLLIAFSVLILRMYKEEYYN